MNPFRYERASDASAAIAMLAQAPSAAFLGGGTNLVDLMKLGVAQPDLLIDVAHLPYDRIELLPDGGIRIGAAVRNSDLAADHTIRARRRCLRAPRASYATWPQPVEICCSVRGASTSRMCRSRATSASRAAAVPRAKAITATWLSSEHRRRALRRIHRTWLLRWSPWMPSCAC